MTTTVIDGNVAGEGAAPRRLPRIPLIDQLRALALVAMAVYHFTWDLGFFGYIEPDTATTGTLARDTVAAREASAASAPSTHAIANSAAIQCCTRPAVNIVRFMA